MSTINEIKERQARRRATDSELAAAHLAELDTAIPPTETTPGICICGSPSQHHINGVGPCLNCEECKKFSNRDATETGNVTVKAEHTATPWGAYPAIGEAKAYISPRFGQFRLAELESDNYLADADFIVKAVNSHDALVAGCKKALTCASLNSDVRALIVVALAEAGQ